MSYINITPRMTTTSRVRHAVFSTPNGRIWDLALTAGRHVKNAADLGKITETLRKHGARRV